MPERSSTDIDYQQLLVACGACDPHMSVGDARIDDTFGDDFAEIVRMNQEMGLYDPLFDNPLVKAETSNIKPPD